jgi:hypothetical protein
MAELAERNSGSQCTARGFAVKDPASELADRCQAQELVCALHTEYDWTQIPAASQFVASCPAPSAGPCEAKLVMMSANQLHKNSLFTQNDDVLAIHVGKERAGFLRVDSGVISDPLTRFLNT